MIAANDIANKKFEQSRKGYKTTDVDAFLTEVATAFSQVSRENAELKRKLDAVNKKISDFENDQESLSQALLNAQRLADSIVREAQAKADLTIRDAGIKAEKIKEKVKDAILDQQMEFTDMKKQVAEFRKNILGLYKAQVQLIMESPGEEELKTETEPEQKPEEAAESTGDGKKGSDAGDGCEKSAENIPQEHSQWKDPVKQNEQAPADGKTQTAENPEEKPESQGEEMPEDGRKQSADPNPEIQGRDPKIRLNLKFDESRGEYLPLDSGKEKRYAADAQNTEIRPEDKGFLRMKK